MARRRSRSQRLSYSSWRRNHGPVSLHPFGARSKISVTLVATEPPALWSSEQNVPTAQPCSAKKSLFSKTSWPQA